MSWKLYIYIYIYIYMLLTYYYMLHHYYNVSDYYLVFCCVNSWFSHCYKPTHYFQLLLQACETGSSESTVSGYGLEDRRSRFDPQQSRKNFSSSLCVQTGSMAHPASCTMGTGILYQGLKRGRGVTLITHPHPIPRSKMSRSCTSSPTPQAPPWRVVGQL
jgi:hypothetical protein